MVIPIREVIMCLQQAASFPTIVVYVMDTVRSCSPVTFMSNMLYACSILYKMRLPFIIAMNKVELSYSSLKYSSFVD